MNRLGDGNSQSIFMGLYQGQQILTESHEIQKEGMGPVTKALERQVKSLAFIQCIAENNKKMLK